MIYFQYCSDYVVLKPLLESPVIQRAGVTKVVEGEPPTMEKWRKVRTAVYGVSDLKKSEDGTEYEVVNGVKVIHHN
jgi:hypothetical protein